MIKWIDRSLIESPYCIGLCLNEQSFNQELRRLKVPQNQWPKWVTFQREGGKCHFLNHTKTHDLCAIVCLKVPKDKDKIDIYGLIVHEAVHIWQFICEEINEDEPCKEFEAYSIQTISVRLFAAYEEMTQKPLEKVAKV